MHPIHKFIAAYLDVPPVLVLDESRFREDLGLQPIDLVQIMLEVEARDLGTDDFPIEWVDGAVTVGDLVAVYDDWMAQRDTYDEIVVSA